jgi:hypothetical protein
VCGGDDWTSLQYVRCEGHQAVTVHAMQRHPLPVKEGGQARIWGKIGIEWEFEENNYEWATASVSSRRRSEERVICREGEVVY